ncbi:Cytochrome c, class I [Candidatus Sulfopaludibacter sp. SbA4]|nr:Cytochrome c, class I [Candidatus Sulfopaludibacter sp. SbA4]
MKRAMFVVAAGAFAWSAHAASIIPGDARRGEQLFDTEQCIQCHSVKGRGGDIAPDLARRVDRNYTPTVMASLMWNHAPDMWAAMKKHGISQAHMTPESAADLFAYFVSARYFEQPGDAGRGKQAFAAKHCAECHGVTTSNAAGAPPIAKWESLGDPIILAQQMWNHGAKMREAFAQKKLAWQALTAQELTDILVYLQNLPETRTLAQNFQFPPSDSGEALFQSKGCSGCHVGKLALETRLRNQTLTQIVVDMWNHQPSMKNPPPVLSQEEMRQILSYVWAKQYFRGNGTADRGKKVFSDKNCATCHNDPSSGAPKLAKGKDAYSDITMVAALWEHGPHMLELMNQKKLAWPRFTAEQMSDLIAYLNSL